MIQEESGLAMGHMGHVWQRASRSRAFESSPWSEATDLIQDRPDAIYFGGTHVDENVPGQALEAKPGTRFRYANNDTLLAAYGLRAAIGDDAKYNAFPFTELFWRRVQAWREDHRV